MKTEINNKSGIALVTVVCFLALTGAIIAFLLRSTVSNYRMAGSAVELEMAIYVAEAGAERAVAHIAADGEVPVVIKGTMGVGRYETTIMASDSEGSPYNGEHILNGLINLNPNNNSDNEFTMTLIDGTIISRDDLAEDFPGFSGSAKFIRLQPKGNGNQNSLNIDGAPYNMQNGTRYDITAENMSVQLYNDNVNANGKAMGQWWLNVNGGDVAFVSGDGDMDTIPRAKSFNIVSVGTAGTTARRVTLSGLRNMSWAQFALWSHNNRDIYFKSGEKFFGPVHANSTLWFSGDPHFYDALTSSADHYGGNINDCTFDQGLELEVPVDTMADIDFDKLRDEAASSDKGTIINGDVWVVLDGKDLKIGTEQDVEETYIDSHGHEKTRTVTQVVYDTIPDASEELIYVQGDMHIKGQLDGRRTFVTEGDTYIDDNLTYAADPKNVESDDGLGLLSKRDIVVTEVCPDNLQIYAHMMATGVATGSSSDGSFRVENYANGSPRGQLIIHGGIVQDYRGAVGTFNTGTGQSVTGFEKNYTFDSRFADNPPPYYPTLADRYTWDNWTEGAL